MGERCKKSAFQNRDAWVKKRNKMTCIQRGYFNFGSVDFYISAIVVMVDEGHLCITP